MDQSAGILLLLDFIIETTARTHLWGHLMAKPSAPVTHHTLVNTSQPEGELLNQPSLTSSLRRAEWGQTIWRDEDVMSEVWLHVCEDPAFCGFMMSALVWASQLFFSCDNRETSDGTCPELLTEQLRRRWWRWSTRCHTPHHTPDSPYSPSNRWFSSARLRYLSSPSPKRVLSVIRAFCCTRTLLFFITVQVFCNVAELMNTLPETSQTSNSSFMVAWCMAGVL